jgi:hypothetical protein
MELQEDERALEWLERAATGRDYWLLNVGVEPAFDRIRDTQRYRDTLQAIRPAG